MQKNLKHIEKFVKFTYKKNKKKLINSVINVNYSKKDIIRAIKKISSTKFNKYFI